MLNIYIKTVVYIKNITFSFITLNYLLVKFIVKRIKTTIGLYKCLQENNKDNFSFTTNSKDILTVYITISYSGLLEF